MKSWVDWVALVASICTIVSVAINVIQWRTQENVKHELKALLQASYNQFCKIADKSAAVFKLAEKGLDSTPAATAAVAGLAKHIQGVADGARSYVIAGAREHLAFVPRFELLREPKPYPLDRIEEPGEQRGESSAADSTG